MTFSQTIQQKIDNCIKNKNPLLKYLDPRVSIGIEPFSNVTSESRLENKRRMMYYFLKSRGRDADWVFDNSFTNDDLINKINDVVRYIDNLGNTFPGEESDIQSPEDVYWFLYLFGDIPIDFSVVDDCVVNWNSVEALSKFISDINNQHLFLNQDGTISFTTLGNLHHASTQKGFKDCYELPFSGNQLDRSKIIEKKDILIPNFSFGGSVISNAGVQQKVSLNDCVTTVINGLKSSGKYDAAIQQYGSLEALKQQVTLDCQKKIDTAENKEESKTPWGWIIGGVALTAIIAGGGYYYYSTSKNKSSGSLRASEPSKHESVSRFVPLSEAKKGDMVEFEIGTPWPGLSTKKEKVTGKVVYAKKNGTLTVNIERTRENPGGHSNEDVCYVDISRNSAKFRVTEPTSKNKSSGSLRASEPARRYGHPLMINFYNEKGQHLLGSDGTIVILKSDGIKTVRGAMNRLREYKKLNRIPPWAKSYMILDYDTLDSSGLPATLGSGSIDSI